MRLREHFSRTRAALLLPALILGTAPTVFGQANSCDADAWVCDPAGFTFALIGFDPAAGTTTGSSTWTYEICVDSSTCPPPTDFHDLSHFDIVLPDLGGLGGCVSDDHQITLTQSDGEENAILSCDGSTQNQACGLGTVAKCDIDSGTLDDGECVQVELTIAGEEVVLASGEIAIFSKASTNCVETPILGPSCESCDGPTGGDGGACLTRTIGFWGDAPQHHRRLSRGHRLRRRPDARRCRLLRLGDRGVVLEPRFRVQEQLGLCHAGSPTDRREDQSRGHRRRRRRVLLGLRIRRTKYRGDHHGL